MTVLLRSVGADILLSQISDRPAFKKKVVEARPAAEITGLEHWIEGVSGKRIKLKVIKCHYVRLVILKGSVCNLVLNLLNLSVDLVKALHMVVKILTLFVGESTPVSFKIIFDHLRVRGITYIFRYLCGFQIQVFPGVLFNSRHIIFLPVVMLIFLFVLVYCNGDSM